MKKQACQDGLCHVRMVSDVLAHENTRRDFGLE
jgi:hypothetical protein